MSRPAKPVPMCCVSIGFGQDLILPTDKGLKLVEILQSSFECAKEYASRGYVYRLKDGAPQVEFSLVQPKQILTADSPLSLGYSAMGGDV